MNTQARVLTTLLAMALCAGTAHAQLAPTDGAPGGAQTLPRGVSGLGLILRPTAYGITDRIQLGSQLLPLLLAMPNAEVKLRALDGAHVDVTARASYLHSFYLVSTGVLAGELIGAVNSRTGSGFGLKVGAARSFVFGDGEADLGPFSLQARGATSVTFGAYAEVALSRADLVYASADFSRGLVEPTNVKVNGLAADDLRWDVRVMYGHAWKKFRLGAGLVHTRAMLDNRDPADPADDDREPPALPVYPMLDLWWRFN